MKRIVCMGIATSFFLLVFCVPSNFRAQTRYVEGMPQCARTQYEYQGASLFIVNTCNVPISVVYTSDSGNTWGESVNVSPGSSTEVTAFGMGYNPQTDGRVWLYTCPNGTQPVMPDGNFFLPHNYKGAYSCAFQP